MKVPSSVNARYFILIFLSLAVLMITSALIELNESKKDLRQLMEEEAQSLLETLTIASRNILKTNAYFNDAYQERLLNNAYIVKRLYENNNLSNKLLNEICLANNLRQIDVYAPSGKILFSNTDYQTNPSGFFDASVSLFNPIFSADADTQIIGIIPDITGSTAGFVAALATDDRSAIVINADARELIQSRRETGFGVLLRNAAGENPAIIYASLQDTTSLLAASGNVRTLESINDSDFLLGAYRDTLFHSRITTFDSVEVLEAVYPFVFNDYKIGLFRIGLSLQAMERINRQIYTRMFIITIILIFIGSLMVTFFIVRQRYSSLQKDYGFMETYSGSIIENVSDAIIVYNAVDGIRIFNSAAEKLFKLKRQTVTNQALSRIFSDSDCRKILDEPSTMFQISCEIGSQKHHLLISKNIFYDSDQQENVVLVVRDLTRQKMMEEKIQRKERLEAMGGLAAGVAHEIRNPLNTIGTIIQQLDKDFEPGENQDEYHELAQLVYGEVKRINETIQQFLKFARPDPPRPAEFELHELVKQIQLQYAPIARENNITLKLTTNWKGRVKWDQNQIKQVIGNLIQNAIEAIGQNGQINLSISKYNASEILITITDDGPGMSKEVRQRLFNLYFTTKSGGTGIGLSIVQRIIYDHNGVIEIESEVNKGSAFKIRLPKRLS